MQAGAFSIRTPTEVKHAPKRPLFMNWPWEGYVLAGVAVLFVGGLGTYAIREYRETARAEAVVFQSVNEKLSGRVTFVSLRRSPGGFEGTLGSINGSTYPITVTLDVHGQPHYQSPLVNHN